MKTMFDSRPCLSVAEIRDYLQEELSSASRHRVENHLLDCQLCSAAVEGYANTHHPTALELDIRHVQRKISREKPLRASSTGRRRYLPFNRAAAAVLLLLIAGAAWFYWGNTRGDRLFADHFTHGPSHIVNLRAADVVDLPTPELLEAISAYDQGDYPVALVHFEKYLARHPDNFEAMYYAGIAYLETEQIDRAVDYLERARINDARLYEEASWYLALAELKAGDKAAARHILQELIEGGNGDFREEAAVLLGKLD